MTRDLADHCAAPKGLTMDVNSLVSALPACFLPIAVIDYGPYTEDILLGIGLCDVVRMRRGPAKRTWVGSSMRPSRFSVSSQLCVGGRSAAVAKSRSSRLVNTRSSPGLKPSGAPALRRRDALAPRKQRCPCCPLVVPTRARI